MNASDEQAAIGDAVDRLYAAGWTLAFDADNPLPGMDRLHLSNEATGQRLETVVTTGAEWLRALTSVVTGNMQVRTE